MKPLGPAEAPALAVPLIRPIGIQVSTYDIHVPPQVTESYKELGMYGKVTHTLRACQQVGWAQPVPPPPKAEPKPSTLKNADSKMSLTDWLQQYGRFKVGDDILYPDDSKNRQVTQWNREFVVEVQRKT